MSDISIPKIIIMLAISSVLTLALIEGLWGLTSGAIIGVTIGKDKTLQSETSKFLKEKGIKETDSENMYKNLPPEVRKDLDDFHKRVLKERILPNINWFGITFLVSIIVFSITGFLYSFITRDFIFVGFIPALSFIINNPVVRFAHAINLDTLQKLIIVVFAQFGICYLFGYLGVWLGKKRYKKRMNNAVEPS